MPDASSYVYVIGCPSPATGPVKIGWTARDPESRLAQLRTDGTLTPDSVDRANLQVLYSCEGDRSLERALHFRFRQLRVTGEWFSLNPAVAPREVRMAIAEIPPVGTPEHGAWRGHPAFRDPGSKRPAPAATKPKPVLPAAPTLAELQYRQFNDWVRAGFTEDQALKMVAMLAGGG